MFSLSRNPDRERGCTLIELIVGIALLGLLTALIAVAFSSLSHTNETIEAEREIARQARVCFALLADELLMTRTHSWFPLVGRDGESDGFADDSIAFVSMSHEQSTDAAPRSLRVVYARDGDHLSRFALHDLYSLRPEPIERIDVVSRVSAFNLHYYDGETNQWVDEWDETMSKSLPRFVLVELTLLDARNEPHTFVDRLLIPSNPASLG